MRSLRGPFRTLPLLASVWLLVALVYLPQEPKPEPPPVEPPGPRIVVLHAAPSEDLQAAPSEDEGLRDSLIGGSVGPSAIATRIAARGLVPAAAFPKPIIRRPPVPSIPGRPKTLRASPRERWGARQDPTPDISLYGLPRPDASVRRFTFRGELFDMLTLKPVAGARLSFAEPGTGRTYPAVTDANGAYQTALPASEDGFVLSISCPGYSPKYIEDWTPSFRTLSSRRRSALGADDLIRPREPLLLFPGKTDTLSRDFALLRRHG